MPFAFMKAKLPNKSQLKAMSKDERVVAELKAAEEIGVRHKGSITTGANFRSTRTTSRESTLIGLKRPSSAVMRRNDADVQPGTLVVGPKLLIPEGAAFSPEVIERQILAQAERMGNRSFEKLAQQLVPQINALGVMGKQSRRIKAVQAALSKRMFGDKALTAMKRKKGGGIAG